MRQGVARHGIAACATLFCVVLAAHVHSQGQAPADAAAQAPATAPAAGGAPVTPQRALINQYCLGCHSDKLRSGGLALSQLNLDSVDQSAEIAEKVIRKLRGGLMPPAGVRRPDSQSVAAFVSWLENGIDTRATQPHPGRVALRRLNR